VTADATPGLDLEDLRAFLDRERPGMVNGGLRAQVIAGGRSNLTYDVTDGHDSWIVRRPPLGHVLATAHDMSREHRVISALEPTEVPVPRTFVLCEDTSVLGAPFYVMEKVGGTPYRRAAQLDAIGARRTRDICLRMVDILVALHEVDPVKVGLADFGRPEGFLTRQVRRWKKQADSSRSRDIPGMDDLHARLEASVPEQQAPAIVHGDYRLDNLLVDDADQVTAVLDWEMATVGDPLTDVALLVVYRGIAKEQDAGPVADAPSASGFLGTEEMVERYAERSGRDLSAMGFYVALAYFKLAVVLEGIHYRYTQGQTVGAGFEDVGRMVGPLVSAGLHSLDASV
jgi:aminoglycoside phosphotransferase (APT) family kinase protein